MARCESCRKQSRSGGQGLTVADRKEVDFEGGKVLLSRLGNKVTLSTFYHYILLKFPPQDPRNQRFLYSLRCTACKRRLDRRW